MGPSLLYAPAPICWDMTFPVPFSLRGPCVSALPSLKHSPGLSCWAAVQRELQNAQEEMCECHTEEKSIKRLTICLSAGKTAPRGATGDSVCLHFKHFVSQRSIGGWLTEAEGNWEMLQVFTWKVL